MQKIKDKRKIAAGVLKEKIVLKKIVKLKTLHEKNLKKIAFFVKNLM